MGRLLWSIKNRYNIVGASALRVLDHKMGRIDPNKKPTKSRQAGAAPRRATPARQDSYYIPERADRSRKAVVPAHAML